MELTPPFAACWAVGAVVNREKMMAAKTTNALEPICGVAS